MLRKMFSFFPGIKESGTEVWTSGHLDKLLSHTLGNMLNEIIFGTRYFLGGVRVWVTETD
jgi:hypothetical protein